MEKNIEKEEKNTEKSASVLRFIGQNARGQIRWFAMAVLASVLSVATNFAVPQIIRLTVDSILGSQPAGLPLFLVDFFKGLTQKEGLRTVLFVCAGAALAFSVAAALFSFASRMCMATGTERFSKNLRDRLYRHVQYLPFKWHVENQTGDIIQRCTSDLDVVRNFVASQFLEVVRTILLVVIALMLMFSMNVTLSLVSLAFIPVVFLYSTVFYQLIGSRFMAADEAEGDLTVAVQENLTGVRVVRAFGRERFELERFDKYNNFFADLWIRLGRTLGLYWGIGDLVTGLQIFSVILVGAILAVKGNITLGEFLVFVSYNQALVWPVRAMGRTLAEMSKTGVSAYRIQEILLAETETEEPNAQQPDLHTNIRFENVTFGYGHQTVLNNLSFTIPKGSTFGILGATGSGKSTITYLLNRLYELPDGGGSIWFGDTEIRNIDRYYLRRNVGLVLQEPFLFSKTIEENITIGHEHADLLQVRHAAGIADVDNAITEFTSGYDTVVGERGVTLSGGQKQRVAIARTLMLQAPVMVFDDSMSAVDLETDARIRAALREHTQDTTVIIISHRINTLMQADQILVLEDGCMTALGTHEQLIRTPGLYKRIYDMQSDDSDPVAAQEGGRNDEKRDDRVQ